VTRGLYSEGNGGEEKTYWDFSRNRPEPGREWNSGSGPRRGTRKGGRVQKVVLTSTADRSGSERFLWQRYRSSVKPGNLSPGGPSGGRGRPRSTGPSSISTYNLTQLVRQRIVSDGVEGRGKGAREGIYFLARGVGMARAGQVARRGAPEPGPTGKGRDGRATPFSRPMRFHTEVGHLPDAGPRDRRGALSKMHAERAFRGWGIAEQPRGYPSTAGIQPRPSGPAGYARAIRHASLTRQRAARPVSGRSVPLMGSIRRTRTAFVRIQIFLTIALGVSGPGVFWRSPGRRSGRKKGII